jgi:hypothetical protein
MMYKDQFKIIYIIETCPIFMKCICLLKFTSLQVTTNFRDRQINRSTTKSQSTDNQITDRVKLSTIKLPIQIGGWHSKIIKKVIKHTSHLYTFINFILFNIYELTVNAL